MEKASDVYLRGVLALLESKIGDPSLEEAAQLIAERLSVGGLLYTFGTGHAHLLSEELFYRAGGLTRVYPILEEPLMLHQSASASTGLERRPGYAREILSRYPIGEKDVLMVSSNSGRNAVPVELALEARARGAKVIALTSLKHSGSVTPRSACGKRLFEVADLVLDNGGEIGDACVQTPSGLRVGPTSTAVGAAMLQAIVCRVQELCEGWGKPLDFFSSSNIDGGDAINQRYLDEMKPIVKCL